VIDGRDFKVQLRRRGARAVSVHGPSTKKRPAVVVSSHSYNASRRDIVIMAITSQVRTPLGFGGAMVRDWQGAGLIKTSVLKPVFTTIEQGLVIRTMGTLAAADIKTLREIVADVIG